MKRTKETVYHTSRGDYKDSLQELQLPPSSAYYNGQNFFDFFFSPSKDGQANIWNIYQGKRKFNAYMSNEGSPSG